MTFDFDLQLSVFIRTNTSGLPVFLGTPVGGSKHIPRTLTDDFMAIEVTDDGYVRLTTNLGAGAHSIMSDQRVDNYKWHKIHVKR